MYDESEPHTSTSRESPDTRGELPGGDVPERCSYCRRPLDDEQGGLLLMRDGHVVAAYHERCHPHHRRSGCSAC